MLLSADVVNNVHDVLRYNEVDEQQVTSMEHVRDAAASMILTIMKECPPSADRTFAIRLVRMALMTANCSIALRGLSIVEARR